MASKEPIKLTTFSHGSGCGCKIAPGRLANMLQGKTAPNTSKLLVGNSSNDDAAVYALNETDALISTTDFFMPIVDDAFDFGRIAAANALSDVYAMGGKPIMALAILGWPIDKLSDELAAAVLEGGREICAQAGIPLAGGHSIDNLEPLFGLCVNGLVKHQQLKRNNTAKQGDFLFLTKPLGTGIVATAIKRGLATPNQIDDVVRAMTTLNEVGEQLAVVDGVNAMTDITGFGLVGHLVEMAEGAQLSAELWFDKIPTFNNAYLSKYISGFVIPDNTFRNYNSYKPRIEALSASQLPILCDPQTSGGLLISASEAAVPQVREVLLDSGISPEPIGVFNQLAKKLITVK